MTTTAATVASPGAQSLCRASWNISPPVIAGSLSPTGTVTLFSGSWTAQQALASGAARFSDAA